MFRKDLLKRNISYCLIFSLAVNLLFCPKNINAFQNLKVLNNKKSSNRTQKKTSTRQGETFNKFLKIGGLALGTGVLALASFGIYKSLKGSEKTVNVYEKGFLKSVKITDETTLGQLISENFAGAQIWICVVLKSEIGQITSDHEFAFGLPVTSEKGEAKNFSGDEKIFNVKQKFLQKFLEFRKDSETKDDININDYDVIFTKIEQKEDLNKIKNSHQITGKNKSITDKKPKDNKIENSFFPNVGSTKVRSFLTSENDKNKEDLRRQLLSGEPKQFVSLPDDKTAVLIDFKFERNDKPLTGYVVFPNGKVSDQDGVPDLVKAREALIKLPQKISSITNGSCKNKVSFVFLNIPQEKKVSSSISTQKMDVKKVDEKLSVYFSYFVMKEFKNDPSCLEDFSTIRVSEEKKYDVIKVDYYGKKCFYLKKHTKKNNIITEEFNNEFEKDPENLKKVIFFKNPADNTNFESIEWNGNILVLTLPDCSDNYKLLNLETKNLSKEITGDESNDFFCLSDKSYYYVFWFMLDNGEKRKVTSKLNSSSFILAFNNLEIKNGKIDENDYKNKISCFEDSLPINTRPEFKMFEYHIKKNLSLEKKIVSCKNEKNEIILKFEETKFVNKIDEQELEKNLKPENKLDFKFSIDSKEVEVDLPEVYTNSDKTKINNDIVWDLYKKMFNVVNSLDISEVGEYKGNKYSKIIVKNVEFYIDRKKTFNHFKGKKIIDDIMPKDLKVEKNIMFDTILYSNATILLNFKEIGKNERDKLNYVFSCFEKNKMLTFYGWNLANVKPFFLKEEAVEIEQIVFSYLKINSERVFDLMKINFNDDGFINSFFGKKENMDSVTFSRYACMAGDFFTEFCNTYLKSKKDRISNSNIEKCLKKAIYNSGGDRKFVNFYDYKKREFKTKDIMIPNFLGVKSGMLHDKNENFLEIIKTLPREKLKYFKNWIPISNNNSDFIKKLDEELVVNTENSDISVEIETDDSNDVTLEFVKS